MDFSRVFVFVLASFEADSYFHFIQMRKEIFSKYNIPHMFLFENEPPSYYACDSNDYVLEREKFAFDPTITLIPGFHPLMIVKFLKGLQKIDFSKYDFILRINLSTYINFPATLKILSESPKEKLLAGFIFYFTLPDYEIYKHKPHKFASGTCMIFSSDVAKHLTHFKLDNPELYVHCDDTVLSHLCVNAVKHFVKIELLFIHNNRQISDEELLAFPIIRIKYPADKRVCELQRWQYLMMLVDKIDYKKNPIIDIGT